MDIIEAKVKRKKDLRKEIADRHNNVDTFVLKMINDLEDMAANTTNTSLLVPLAGLYAKSFEGQIQTIDPNSTIEIQWVDSSEIPRVNGILIKWSKDYQDKNNCEEQLFVDVISLLLK